MINEENKAVEAEETAEVKKETKKEKKSKKNAEVDALKAEIEKLSADLAALKDSHLRTLAEYDNYRKRTQKEKEVTDEAINSLGCGHLCPCNFGFGTKGDWRRSGFG